MAYKKINIVNIATTLTRSAETFISNLPFWSIETSSLFTTYAILANLVSV